jgi:hypothetical protein
MLEVSDIDTFLDSKKSMKGGKYEVYKGEYEQKNHNG